MKFDFKDKKFMITASTVAVVVLGVFIGVKVMMNADAKSSLAQVSSGTEKQITDDENAIADSLKQKAEEENGKKDEKDKESGAEGEENKSKDATDEAKSDGDKNGTEDKDTKTTGNQDSKKDDEHDKSSSQSTENTDSTVKVVKVYDDQYIVKKGDTLYTIGKKFFVEDELTEGINTMKKINKIGLSDLIKEGDKLYIPVASNSPKKTSEVMGKDYRSYIVKKGDTLTNIVKEEMEWCDVDTGLKLIKDANKISNDTIKENQKLIIPTKK